MTPATCARCLTCNSIQLLLGCSTQAASVPLHGHTVHQHQMKPLRHRDQGHAGGVVGRVKPTPPLRLNTADTERGVNQHQIKPLRHRDQGHAGGVVSRVKPTPPLRLNTADTERGVKQHQMKPLRQRDQGHAGGVVGTVFDNYFSARCGDDNFMTAF